MFYKHLNRACDNFFNNILQLETKECKTKRYKDFFCSKISIYKDEDRFDALFLFKKDSVNLISDILLYDKNPDQETFIDIIKECANLIGGNTKMLLEESDPDSNYTLSTPEFLGIIKSIDEINFANFSAKKIKNRCFIFGIEEK